LTHPGNTNTTNPLLFVDVDGVISLFGFNHDSAPEGRFHSINGVLHYISPVSGPLLQRLRDSFELVWATGWEETANDYLPHLLGLPGELPWVSFEGRGRFGTAHWKIEAIDQYAGTQRPVAWIDDCLDGDCYAWAQRRPGSTLLVPTHSHEGMRAEHVDRLLAWAAALRTDPARASMGSRTAAKARR
jgi:HAD domain in Swiss Army Knife RNA repair proteins